MSAKLQEVNNVHSWKIVVLPDPWLLGVIVCTVTAKTNDESDNVKSICCDNSFQEIGFMTWISYISIAKI